MSFTAGMTSPDGDRKLVLDYGSPLNKHVDRQLLERTAKSLGAKYSSKITIEAGAYRSKTQEVAEDELADFIELKLGAFLAGIPLPMDVVRAFGNRHLVLLQEHSLGATEAALTDLFATLGLPVAIYGRERMLASAESVLARSSAELARTDLLGGVVRSKARGSIERVMQRVLGASAKFVRHRSQHDIEMEERIAGKWEGHNQYRGETMNTRMSLFKSGHVTFSCSMTLNGKPHALEGSGKWKIEDGRLMCTFLRKGVLNAPDVDSRVVSLSSDRLELEERMAVIVMHRVA